MPNDRCAVVVHSCDAYADVWPLFFAAFCEHWPDCEFRIVLSTETRSYVHPGLDLTVHNSGQVGWGARLLDTMQSIEASYVISLFDDFVLESAVDVQQIRQCIQWLDQDNSISVFYLSHIPGASDASAAYPCFAQLPAVVNYKLNSAPAVWRTASLRELTRPTDDPWVWELFGTARAFFGAGRFFCALPDCEHMYVYDYRSGGAIYRGQWVEAVVAPKIQRYGLSIDLNTRGIASGQGTARSLAQKFKMVAAGFRAVGWKAMIVIGLLLKQKFQHV